MPRVVPSQVVPVLENRFPSVIDPGQAIAGGSFALKVHVRGVVALIERIPEELYQTSPSDFAEFVSAVEILRAYMEEPGSSRPVSPSQGDAIRTIHRVLQSCPDDAPATGTSDPAFIADPELRADLHRDLGEVNRSLHNGEWKGATVLAGSIVEALLLWALQTKKTPVDIQNAATALGKSINLGNRPLERWELHELIEYAHATSLISDATRATADQGRDFRNLIHPGKAIRLAQKCNRWGRRRRSSDRRLELTTIDPTALRR